MELERILLEKSDVQEILMKVEAMCSNYEQDKQRLQEDLKKVTRSLYYRRDNERPILIINAAADDRRKE